MKTYLAQLVLTLIVFLLCPLAEACAPQSACLQWTPPSNNTDGTTLTNLAGYTVYYGTSVTALTSTQVIGNAGTITSILGPLAPGVWFFAIDAVNAASVHSDKSPTVSKQILAPVPAPPSQPMANVGSDLTAYDLAPTDDGEGFQLLRVGIVAPGTFCSTNRGFVTLFGVTYYPVSHMDVTFDYGFSSATPLARCN